jgi:hypothetical protein
MPIIPVWHFPGTKKYFESKVEYRAYLRTLAEKRLKEFNFKKAVSLLDAKFAEMTDLDSYDEISAWIEQHSGLFYANACLRDKRHFQREQCRIFNVRFLNIKFNQLVRNTHNAPKGKPTNWRGEDHLPKGYPGVKGCISFNYTSDVAPWDLFNNTPIHLGSGGGQSANENRASFYSADVILFEEEWPGIHRMRVLDRLCAD